MIQPLAVIGGTKKYDIAVNVYGGGLVAQAGATRLGISRAILNCDEDFRSKFKQHGFLRSDSRVKERKKYGQRGARRKFQFVKR